MTDIDTPVDNGVNTEALLGAREALSDAPEAAEFTWRANCSWVGGTFSQTTVDGFSGLGQEHHHKTPYSFDADHPECFASEDRGATPPEILLAAAFWAEIRLAHQILGNCSKIISPNLSLQQLHHDCCNEWLAALWNSYKLWKTCTNNHRCHFSCFAVLL